MKNSKNSRFRTICADAYWWTQVLLGGGVLCWMFINWQAVDHLRFLSYLTSAIIASVLKVRLPGVTGTASVSFLFMLIGVVDLSTPEAIAIASLSMLAQCLWRTQRRPKPRQVCFSVASIVVAVYLSSFLYSHSRAILPEPAALGGLALFFYVTNVCSVAVIIALTESQPLWEMCTHSRWLLPYYAGATSLAWMIGTMPRAIQWEVPIICLPVVYLVHRSYSTYLVQMQQDKSHMEEMNRVHMRTIEALALAIDAKDHTTHDHLQRVQLYALEIGRELGLGTEELDALRAASVLHDIGKLAVPEHIISKPGKLTPAEFQKMKIHPVVGAEILERVSFPYPVVPMVRSHHEKWNGCGYPDGLAGESIPIGARILAAVDCFDALASDRQYRRALPLDEAIAKVVSESGTSFDPAVVDVLQRRYRELEERAKALSAAEPTPALSTDICITRGAAPAAGFAAESTTAAEHPGRSSAMRPPAFSGLTLEEALAVLAVRIKAVVPYDAIAYYSREGDVLTSTFTAGTHATGLAGLRIPIGEGLAGWVAEAGRPIINGNPMVEPGYNAELESAMAIAVEGAQTCTGVLALYRRGRDAFNSQDVSAITAFGRALSQASDTLRSYEEPRGAAVLARAV